MNNFRNKSRNRYYQANVTSFGTIQLHQRNPLIVALWSVSFPGFGHFLVHKFITGFALFFWEFYINQLTHLNKAMMYSFNGNIDQAKAVLNEKYIYLYIPVYLFAIWDSYRIAVDENKLHLLARRENAKFPRISISPFEMNYLDKKKALARLGLGNDRSKRRTALYSPDCSSRIDANHDHGYRHSFQSNRGHSLLLAGQLPKIQRSIGSPVVSLFPFDLLFRDV